MTRWLEILTPSHPDPDPWHPDEYVITFDRPATPAPPCTVHVIIESGTTMLRKHPTVTTPCTNAGVFKVYANGVLMSDRRACAVHTAPSLWLPHAHYAAGIRPRRALPLPSHRW